MLVPKSVDERVQHRGNGSSENCHTFVNGHLLLSRRLDVDEDAAAIGDGNHNHVGRAGREGFSLVGQKGI